MGDLLPDLLPCPFCGHTAPRIFPKGKMQRPYVQCRRCPASTDSSVVPLAVEAWNARIPSPERLAALEECAASGRELVRAIWEAFRADELPGDAPVPVAWRVVRAALARLDAAEDE
jgi:hypothetical protein